MTSLTVSSFNCKNFKTSTDEIAILCNSNDIILFQETWLLDSEANILAEFDNCFYSQGISSMDTCAKLHKGRPYGGTAIFWKKTLGNICTVIDYGDPRLVGIEINVNGDRILIVNVYLPCDSPENSDVFLSYLSKINNIIECFPSPYVYVTGDFNANLLLNESKSICSNFGKELYDFCNQEQLIISDTLFMKNDSYTFISSAHDTVSWLDHVITTSSGHDLISSINIDYSFVTSDHLPVTIKLNFNCTHMTEQDQSANRGKIDWPYLSCAEIDSYKSKCIVILSSLAINVDLLNCNDPSCSSEDHKQAISCMYQAVIDALVVASVPLNPKNTEHKHNFKPTPG